jgi:hypothetical protein
MDIYEKLAQEAMESEQAAAYKAANEARDGVTLAQARGSQAGATNTRRSEHRLKKVASWVLIGQLNEQLWQLGVDELAALLYVAEGIAEGRGIYGEYVALSEKRDLAKEKLQEARDLIVYDGFEGVKNATRRTTGGHTCDKGPNGATCPDC